MACVGERTCDQHIQITLCIQVNGLVKLAIVDLKWSFREFLQVYWPNLSTNQPTQWTSLVKISDNWKGWWAMYGGGQQAC